MTPWIPRILALATPPPPPWILQIPRILRFSKRILAWMTRKLPNRWPALGPGRP